SPPRSAPPRGPRRLRARQVPSTAADGAEQRSSRVPALHDHASITSSMIRVKVNKNDPTDLHEQVAAEIRRAIAEGEARPGERLPPAKALAAVLGVNTNTVLRALRALRDEGLLEFRRGRGITVIGTPEQSAVIDSARGLVQLARHHGYKLDELLEIIQAVP